MLKKEKTDDLVYMATALLVEPLHRVALRDPTVLVIDALDEGSAGPSEHNSLLHMIEKVFDKLPERCTLILTTRPQKHILTLLGNSSINFRRITQNDPRVLKVGL